MIITRKGSLIEILCPAKLNLYLEIRGKRADGYHEIETIMQTISVYDRLVIEPAASGTEIRCSDPEIPCGNENTVWKAVDQVRRATGAAGGVKIFVEKAIPAGGGLAGGSSDAAGAIAGLNELWQLGLSKSSMEEIGAAAGSDVPFFFTAGAAICRGRGEKVTPLAVNQRPLQFVVVFPGFGISTKEIYQRLKLDLTEQQDTGRIFELAKCLASGQAADLGREFFNRLEQTALEARPDLDKVKRSMVREGLLGVTMSGSGSSFFGLCERKEVHSEKKHELSASGVGIVFACESTSR